MSHHEAFLSDIVEHPRDDGPRLVYADWLDDNGDPERAEFIRGQVRLARMNPWDEGFTELDVRCRELARLHPEWLGWLEPFAKQGAVFFGWDPSCFHRGFPARLNMAPKDLVEHHDRLFASAPIQGIQFDYFDFQGPPEQGYADLPGIPRLSEVRFSCLEDPDQAPEVIRCVRRLGRLDHFGVAGCRLRSRHAKTLLATAPVLEARSLRIAGTPLPPTVEQQLTDARFPNLRRLVRIGVPDLSWLRADWIGRLEELTIAARSELAAADLRVLEETLPEMNLTALALDEWPLDIPGARRLGEALDRTRLESLTLSHTRFPDLMPIVFGSEALTSLRALFLTWARLDEDFIRRLTAWGLCAVRVCGLDHVTADGLAALAAGPVLPELASLRLRCDWQNRSGRGRDPVEKTLCSLLDSGALPGLVSLTLCDTRPARDPDPMAKAIARCAGAARLEELRLDIGPLTLVGAAALAESPHLERLRLLDVELAPGEDAACQILDSRFGNRVSLNWESRTY
jgi:uncharacterized protein (TIGR02996 family)